MTVGRICQREVDLAEVDETVDIASKRMGERNVGTLLVVDDQSKPCGLITDRDLTIRVLGQDRDPKTTRVGEVMTNYPRTISEDTPIEQALSLMRALAVRRLPVVAPDGELCGIVSVDDILCLMVEEFRSLGGLLEKTSPHGATPSPRAAASRRS